MEKEMLLNESLLAMTFLEAAINTVQKYVIRLDGMGTEVDPQFALDELLNGMKAAHELAEKGLRPKDFLVPEIRRQRRLLRKQLRKAGLS